MIKRKLLAFGLIATMCLAMTACGGTSNTVEDANTSTNSEVTDSTDNTTEDTENIEDVENSEVTDENLGTTEDLESEDVDLGDAVVLPSDETISNVFYEVRTALDTNYFPNMEIMPEMYETIYGIDLNDVEAAYGEMPMISANVDTFIGILAKEGSVEKVQTALNNYVETMKNDSFQYPQNIAKMPAMEVVTEGNYVFLVATFGDAFVEYSEPTDEQILEVAKNNVTKAKEAISKCFE